MSDIAELSVLVSGRDVNLRALLRQVQTDLRVADGQFTRAGESIASGLGGGARQASAPLQGLSAAERQAASEAAQLARAQAQAQTATQRLATESLRTAAAAQRVATEQQRTAQAAAQVARGEQQVASATAQAEAAQTRAALAAIRLQQARERAAQASRRSVAAELAQPSALRQFSSSFTSGLTGIVAPAAAATAALTALHDVAQSFGDAFVLKAQLDATTESIRLQLAGVRDANQVFQEATAFGDRYRFTQQEMTATIAASVGILRESNSSFTDTASVLARLTQFAPGKTIQDAAFSVRELASGDITSISEQFNISRDRAYAMRDAIQSGADVVQVLDEFLRGAGVTMASLETRTKGAMGAMNDLKVAQEEMALAQAQWAQGPGLAILEVQIASLRGATRLLSGDWDAAGQSLAANMAYYGAFAQVLAQTGDVAQAAAAGTRAAADAAGLATTTGGGASGAWGGLNEELRATAAAGPAAAGGLGKAAIAATAVGTAAARATVLVDGLLSRMAQTQGPRNLANRFAAAGVAAAGTQAQIRSVLASASVPAVTPGGRAGGGGVSAAEREYEQLLKAQQDYQEQSLDAARDHEAALATIVEDGAKKRQAAQRKYDLDRKEGAFSFYERVTAMDNQDLARRLSAQYEAAVVAAQEIARTKGADAAQAYLDAQQQAIQAQGQIEADIAKAEKDKDAPEAERLRGLLALRQAADAEKLRQVTEGGSAIAAEEARQYAEAEQRYSEHLDKLGQTYAKKTGELPGLGATLGSAPAAGTPAVPAPPTSGGVGAQTSPTGPTQVIDVNAQQALDSGLGRLEGVLSEIRAGVAAVEARVGAVEGAVRGLRGSGALAP